MKVLAVDLGERRTGFAVSDPEGRMALSLRTREGVTAVDVARVAEEQGAEIVVVGLPLNMDGSAGPAAQRSLDFIEELKLLVGVPVTGWDERLSTAEGESRLRQAGLDARRRRRRSDAAAAVVILESYLQRPP